MPRIDKSRVLLRDLDGACVQRWSRKRFADVVDRHTHESAELGYHSLRSLYDLCLVVQVLHKDVARVLVDEQCRVAKLADG